MSNTSIQIVKEFFAMNSFLVMQKEDILFVKNSVVTEKNGLQDKFVLYKKGLQCIRNAVVKSIAWHTLKFSPSVLKKSPEIFYFLRPLFLNKAKSFFGKEPFFRILVIPGLPSTENLRKESISFLKNKGIDNVLEFSTVISDLIKKINPRQVYLSETNEILRVLKFYKFFPENQPSLPFKKKLKMRLPRPPQADSQ